MTVTPEAMAMLVDYPWPGNVRELRNVVERIVVHGRSSVIAVEDIPADVRPAWKAARAGRSSAGASVADELYRRMVEDQQSFWTAVYPLFMRREIPRDIVRDGRPHAGSQEARGNYKVVVRMFNMEPGDYKKFLNFLRKHQCQPSFKEFRPSVFAQRTTFERWSRNRSEKYQYL